MLPCSGCAYKRAVPGDAHLRCVFAWRTPESMPKGDRHGVLNGWYLFPYNYDPVWGPNDCPGRSTVAHPNDIARSNAIDDIISLLGKRL